MIEQFVGVYGYVGVFVIAFLINLVPFSSPSNMVISGAIAALFAGMHPLGIAILVALAASVAKIIHYYAGTAVARLSRNESRGRLYRYGERIGKWGAVGAFIIAATPIPDDPVVIPLGMMRYGVVKFFVPYLLGKTTITLAGAYLARFASVTLQDMLGAPEYVAATAIASIVIASLLLKVDLKALSERFRKSAKR